ncbi:MAG: Clp protease N-terminal domain-containing protein, partial [Bacteroidota bacterium]
MEAKFSQRVKEVISFSKEEAVRLGNSYIGVEHLFLGMLREGEGLAIKILHIHNVEILDVRRSIERTIKSSGENDSDNPNIALNKQAERILKFTYLESQTFKSDLIGTEHLLLAILKDEENIVTKTLMKHNVDYDSVKNEIKNLISDGSENTFDPKDEIPGGTGSDEAEDGPYGGETKKPSDSKSKTHVLDNFGRDLTKLAEEDRLDPVVGREKELERIAQILSRRKKNNPVLIGEAGVGKTAIAEGLALRIVQRKVSRALFDKRIVTLD